MANTQATLDKITALCKRRGFVFPSSEVYGGIANVYDFGPYGTLMKENLKNLWIKKFVYEREDIFLIDSSVIMNPQVWEASGHTAGFADVMVEDKVNHKRFRADHLIEEFFERKGQEVKVDGKTPEELAGILQENNIRSPDGNPLTEPRRFNQLFQTEVGIIAGEKNKVYLRGEIAQGLFMNFRNIVDSQHPKLPFGIGQVGKAFRNEITPGKFLHRTLEFDLMEFEYFFDQEIEKWDEQYEYWKKQMYEFAMQLGINSDNLRWREHEDFERSFYSTRTEDLEYDFPWGYKEMWGLAYRTDYDLRNHQEKSGKELRYVYPDGKKILPHVIEPTFGLSRLMAIMLFDAYREQEVNGKNRVYMQLDPKIAPVKAAVFALQRDEKLQSMAESVYGALKQKYVCEFDNSGNIGKMYRRQDEIGTPLCITVDYQSLDDQSVTVRDRDSMAQERVKIVELDNYMAAKILG